MTWNIGLLVHFWSVLKISTNYYGTKYNPNFFSWPVVIVIVYVSTQFSCVCVLVSSYLYTISVNHMFISCWLHELYLEVQTVHDNELLLFWAKAFTLLVPLVFRFDIAAVDTSLALLDWGLELNLSPPHLYLEGADVFLWRYLWLLII